MGTFRERVLLTNPKDPNRKCELDMIVDTGATYTWVPQNFLTSIGIEPEFKRKLKIPARLCLPVLPYRQAGYSGGADGRIIERDASLVNITLNGQILPTICIFGDEDSESLLGAVTLEEFGLSVDPVSKTLVPVPAFLLDVRK